MSSNLKEARVSHMEICGNSKCKGPVAGVCMVCKEEQQGGWWG